jgi:flagellar biosynthesis/type III secretory pathway protein FliH
VPPFALIESSLRDAARKSFEMLPQGQQFFSETQRRSFAQGEAKGEAKGMAEGEARSIVRVLERRGLSVSPEQRERILACADIATLDRWLNAAVTAASAEELFP